VKEFFTKLAQARDYGSADIVELDFQLHRLLRRISENDYLSRNLVFKGGTCLVKAYAGYFRFSQDIDFTWRDDICWNGMSGARLHKRYSSEISNIVGEFKRAADELGLSFLGDKSNDREVHISSGGRMVDLKFRYRSEVLGIPTEIKVQVNLVDLIAFPIVSRPLSSYIDGVNLSDVRMLYPQPCEEYCAKLELPCYDIREIFAEKCRAAMTRVAYKPRDILDIVKMETDHGLSIHLLRNPIIDKTRFALEMYERYDDSIREREFPKDFSVTSEEQKLLLEPIAVNMDAEARRVHTELEDLIREILRQ